MNSTKIGSNCYHFVVSTVYDFDEFNAKQCKVKINKI